MSVVVTVNRINGRVLGYWTIEVWGSRAAVIELLTAAVDCYRAEYRSIVHYSLTIESRAGEAGALLMAVLTTSQAYDLVEIFERFGGVTNSVADFALACRELCVSTE